MIILGIETSCDETAAALVDSDRRVIGEKVFSQLKQHQSFGGVVPEIAARAHGEILPGIVRNLLQETNTDLYQIDGVAATCGPGLIGGVLVGATFGKALAYTQNKPFIAVNHLEGHALTARLTNELAFPYLLLLVSGGHSQWISVNGVSDYTLLGTTLDDALGECFDKAAKLMGLGWPGGPEIERRAAHAENSTRFPLPRPLKGRAGCDFSFSGLKTAVRVSVQKNNFSNADIPDLCASFQYAVADTLADRGRHAMQIYGEMHKDKGRHLIMAGGVAANQFLRERMQDVCDKNNFNLIVPPQSLCTDNAMMIAWAGIERLQLGLTDPLGFRCRPRWPLAELQLAEPLLQ